LLFDFLPAAVIETRDNRRRGADILFQAPMEAVVFVMRSCAGAKVGKIDELVTIIVEERARVAVSPELLT
jgi:hypothetical protein